VEIDQSIFDKWRANNEFYQIYEIDNIIESVKQNFTHESLNLDDVEEVLFREKFSSNRSFFSAETRWTVSFITKDAFGSYYLYVMY